MEKQTGNPVISKTAWGMIGIVAVLALLFALVAVFYGVDVGEGLRF